jgi:hypothetical protein
MLRGYLIRLTREYTDGGMDSHAEEERDNCNELLAVTVINSIKPPVFIKQSQRIYSL